MKDVEKVACNRFSVLCNLMLVNTTLQRGYKLITVLFNDESNELLEHH